MADLVCFLDDPDAPRRLRTTPGFFLKGHMFELDERIAGLGAGHLLLLASVAVAGWQTNKPLQTAKVVANKPDARSPTRRLAWVQARGKSHLSPRAACGTFTESSHTPSHSKRAASCQRRPRDTERPSSNDHRSELCPRRRRAYRDRPLHPSGHSAVDLGSDVDLALGRRRVRTIVTSSTWRRPPRKGEPRRAEATRGGHHHRPDAGDRPEWSARQ